MTKPVQVTRDDVLSAFAMDFVPGGGVLRQYLANYPQYAIDLVDLASELSREIADERPLVEEERAVVSAKLARFQEPGLTLEALQSASPKTFTAAAGALGLPMQVGVALRERRVEVETLPARFLASLALTLKAPVEVVRAFLELPVQASVLRASKSDDKPVQATKIPFERLLREAGVDETTLSGVLNEED
ncbi:hypothetical protein [Pseudomonas aeruginosa]|uniref:hypothetical protein n=1 Tax=Pseudomonas aeruginosa TaxID=287 RepID=UPI002F912552